MVKISAARSSLGPCITACTDIVQLRFPNCQCKSLHNGNVGCNGKQYVPGGGVVVVVPVKGGAIRSFQVSCSEESHL